MTKAVFKLSNLSLCWSWNLLLRDLATVRGWRRATFALKQDSLLLSRFAGCNASVWPLGRSSAWRLSEKAAEPALLPVRKGKVGAPPEARKVLCNHWGAEVFGALKMPDYLGADQRKTKEDEKDDKPIRGQLTQAGAPGRLRTILAGRGGRGVESRLSFCRSVWCGSRVNRLVFSVPSFSPTSSVHFSLIEIFIHMQLSGLEEITHTTWSCRPWKVPRLVVVAYLDPL